MCLCAVIYLTQMSVLLFISCQLRLQHFDVSTCSIKSRRLVTFWIQMSNWNQATLCKVRKSVLELIVCNNNNSNLSPQQNEVMQHVAKTSGWQTNAAGQFACAEVSPSGNRGFKRMACVQDSCSSFFIKVMHWKSYCSNSYPSQHWICVSSSSS